jgi:hypothetical protein
VVVTTVTEALLILAFVEAVGTELETGLVEILPVEEELKTGFGDALGVKDSGADIVLIGTDIDEFEVGEKFPLPAVDEMVSE